MTCSSCGATNRPGIKFCEDCGARLDVRCPACGAAVLADKRFCGECGARLATPAAPTVRREEARTRDPRYAAPSGYTPPHLAQQILRDRAALEGERKQVTVLFADVSEFTRLSERLDPEDVHVLMNEAFERMLAEIHRYDGTVNQFLGDGLMALFGAPVAHEEHARRAALAALGLQRALATYREELVRGRAIDFRVRIGLNTGLVVVGAIGDNLRMDYTAVGDTVNVAARMQQLAEPGQVVIADATRRLVEGHFELRSLGSATLKNRVEPVAAWELGAQTRGVSRAPRGPFLGRDGAMATLERAFGSARAERGQVVCVVGEAGMGKSRLLLELRQNVGDDARWLEGRCVSFGRSTALLPITEALRQSVDAADGDGEAEITAKVMRELERLGSRGAELAPYVRYMLAVDPGDPALMTMDPVARRERIFESLRQLALLSSRLRPTVLVVEDLHWIDSASEEYLKTLIDGLAGASVLLILTYRPTYRPPFGEHTYVSRIVLHPLEESDARQLIRATLGVEDLPDELAATIARKAEGNPFFLEEIGRALVDTGAVRLEGRRLVLARSESTIVVPDRVQDVIAARLDRLDEEQKRTVQVAAVIGREFAPRLLRRVAEAPDRVERALAELKSLELVYEKTTLGDVEYVFKHALTQDVAYESILQVRRRELHARIGAAIEELYAGRLEERAEELAHHFMRGQVWDKAARYARQAGDRAAALCVDAKAVEFYEGALEALERLGGTPEAGRLGIDVRLALRAPLWRAGRLDRLLEIFKEAEVLATQHGETERLDVAYSFFVQYYWAKGELDRAITYGERCLETAARRNDLGLRVTGLYYVGQTCYALGEYGRALAHFRQILDQLEGPLEIERFGLSGLPYCGACALGATCLEMLGDAEGALALIERGERVADVAEHLYSKVPLAVSRGRVLTERGLPDDAIAVLEPTVAVCREKNFVGQLLLALCALGSAYALAGRARDGAGLIREGIDLQEKAGARVTRGDYLARLAEAHLCGGELDEAEAAGTQGLAFADRQGARGARALALRVLGEVARQRGDGAASARLLEEARELADTLGMRPLASRCRATLARLRGE